MAKKHKARYWHPLVIFQDKNYKQEFKDKCKRNKLSCARTIGMLIEYYCLGD